MTKNRPPDAASETPVLSLEKAERGAKTSMWELLLQLRVLLPYIARLAPLLDRGFDRGQAKASPDLSELTEELADIKTGNRDLEVQVRNHALQLERIEQQIAGLNMAQENNLRCSHTISAELRSFRRIMQVIAIAALVLLSASAGMIVFLVLRA